MQIVPKEFEGAVPRSARDKRFEWGEVGRTGTPITAPAAPSATTTTPTSFPAPAPAPELEELRKYLPEGSVYLWAAMMDGAATTDVIAGWIILMVTGRASIVWSSVD